MTNPIKRLYNQGPKKASLSDWQEQANEFSLLGIGDTSYYQLKETKSKKQKPYQDLPLKHKP